MRLETSWLVRTVVALLQWGQRIIMGDCPSSNGLASADVFACLDGPPSLGNGQTLPFLERRSRTVSAVRAGLPANAKDLLDLIRRRALSPSASFV